MRLGDCCTDFADAMNEPEHSMFRVDEENGVLYLSVGYLETPEGAAWLDQAVLFCPFCGKQLQTKEEILQKSEAAQH
jgi:hypothetical protein